MGGVCTRCFVDPYDLPPPDHVPSIARGRVAPAHLTSTSSPPMAASLQPPKRTQVIAVAPAPVLKPVQPLPATETLQPASKPSLPVVMPEPPKESPPPPEPAPEKRRRSLLQQVMQGNIERTSSDAGAASSSRTVSKAELAEHGRDSPEPWIAVKGLVFDVTALLKSHPGGRSVLIDNAGKDGTKEFKEAHSYLDPVKEDKLRLIGKLQK